MSTAVVARLDSLGDVLITGPAVRAVAAAHNRVVFLAGPRGGAAAELLPGVDRVLRWRAGWVDFDAGPVTAPAVAELVDMLAAERPDALLILTSFHQSPLPLALIGRMAGVAWIGAICTDYPGSLLDLRHPDPGDVPEPLRALSLAHAAGWQLPHGDDGRLRVKGLPRLSDPLRAALGAGDYVAFHPGAAVPARRPSADRSAALVAALARAGHHVVVTGTAADRELTARVAGPNRPVATDLGGRTALAELGAVFAGARAVVAPNTGPAHLAAAVGSPIVSLFAPVVPAQRWRPYGVPVVLCGDQRAPCRGSRARNCPVAGHPCLDGIVAADVVAAVAEIGSPRNGRGAA
ncbi:glycosyltransferase family 9 protein [Mycolicibacter sinensis]